MRRSHYCRLIAILAIGSVLSVSGCFGQKELGTIDEDSLVRVEILSCKIAELVLYARDGRMPELNRDKPRPKYLQISVEIANLTPAKKIQYAGWCEEGNLLRRSKLTDEFGNVYAIKPHTSASRLFNFDVVGHNTGPIYPGNFITDLIVFEEPVQKAESLYLELPKIAYDNNSLGTLKFRIRGDSITRK